MTNDVYGPYDVQQNFLPGPGAVILLVPFSVFKKIALNQFAVFLSADEFVEAHGTK